MDYSRLVAVTRSQCDRALRNLDEFDLIVDAASLATGGLRVYCLGTGCSVPSPYRAPAAVYLEHGEVGGVMLDAIIGLAIWRWRWRRQPGHEQQ